MAGSKATGSKVQSIRVGSRWKQKSGLASVIVLEHVKAIGGSFVRVRLCVPDEFSIPGEAHLPSEVLTYPTDAFRSTFEIDQVRKRKPNGSISPRNQTDR